MLRSVHYDLEVPPFSIPEGGFSWHMGTGNLTDEELAVMAKDSDKARAELWARLEPKVEAFNRGRFKNIARLAHSEIGDLLTEAWFVYLEAVKHFEPSLQRPFWPYYSRGLFRHYLDMTRSARRELNSIAKEVSDTVASQDNERAELEAGLWIEAALAEGVKNRNLKVLIFKLKVIDGWTLQELSDRFGPSRGAIDNWVKEVTEALRRSANDKEVGNYARP